MSQCVVISGCSGGGKSTLLEELRRRGYSVVEEPGRRIVGEQLAAGGSALPWVDAILFLQRALALSTADLAACSNVLTFFDRSLVDAALGLEELAGADASSLLAQSLRYHPLVFLAPPWPEIYVTDAERRHGFEFAAKEYEQLLLGYPRLGYDVKTLPKTSASIRANFVLSAMGATRE